MGIKYKTKFGPAKCWKCGTRVPPNHLIHEAQDMIGRPSFTKETYGVYPAKPQFCGKCYLYCQMMCVY